VAVLILSSFGFVLALEICFSSDGSFPPPDPLLEGLLLEELLLEELLLEGLLLEGLLLEELLLEDSLLGVGLKLFKTNSCMALKILFGVSFASVLSCISCASSSVNMFSALR
jgi:hypothetical protein